MEPWFGVWAFYPLQIPPIQAENCSRVSTKSKLPPGGSMRPGPCEKGKLVAGIGYPWTAKNTKRKLNKTKSNCQPQKNKNTHKNKKQQRKTASQHLAPAKKNNLMIPDSDSEKRLRPFPGALARSVEQSTSFPASCSGPGSDRFTRSRSTSLDHLYVRFHVKKAVWTIFLFEGTLFTSGSV